MLFLGDLYFMIILAISFFCLYALLFVIKQYFTLTWGSPKKLFVGKLPTRLLTPTKDNFLCELSHVTFVL